jgi:hypothetical protein
MFHQSLVLVQLTKRAKELRALQAFQRRSTDEAQIVDRMDLSLKVVIMHPAKP